MKVGIISKEEHCKPHAKAIRAAGHEVKLLGGGPLVDVSPSIEVLVCRTASCAHSADATARAVKREFFAVLFYYNVVDVFYSTVCQLSAVGSHIGDKTGGAAANINTLVELLGNRHGAPCGKTELARGFLLQG